MATQSNTASALAKQFIASCRAAGHRPYISQTGRFGIQLNTHEPTEPRAAHHLGRDYSYTLGFDDRPFVPLMREPDVSAALSMALT